MRLARWRHFLIPHHTNNYKARLLHPLPLLLLGAGILAFQVFLGVGARRLPAILGYASAIPSEKIVELTNETRRGEGLSSLTVSVELTQAALTKASDMFAKDYWAHESPGGVEPWKFITNAGYVYVFAGENLARDFTNSKSVIEAWLASPTHRDNLLSPRYEEIGVAVIDGDLAGVPTTLVVQMFGARTGGVPVTTSVAARTRVEGREAEIAVAEVEEKSSVPVVGRGEEERAEAYVMDGGGVLIGEARESYRSLTSPFNLTKTVAVVVLSVLLLVFLLDLGISSRKGLMRMTGRTWAHMAFLGVILIAILVMESGQIL